ncbi:TVP38/TMEM64 family protein [Alicyclobacillaceae bacterium I2511]|nr:TVP38/TMEM64 family protein [Alicyclobacillaceae bacterium I2511]
MKTRSSERSDRRGVWGVVLIFTLGVALLGLFLYLDRNGQISRWIQSAGSWAILLSIFLMALFCIIPVPAEFLMILNMQVFGIWWGILYSWVGSMTGSIAVFLLARYTAGNFIRRFITPDRLAQVDHWVENRGNMGLLLVHLIPLPFIVVNYAAGILRSVKLWGFIWTSALGGVPYYLGAAFIFLGVSHRYMVWLMVGGVVVGIVWGLGYLYNRRVSKLARWAH